ncbi:MAG: S8 family serine peptidase, partial [Planctomycetota bacterium]|nr:S8 family serine peptidase [Planctomycetota bacterium]
NDPPSAADHCANALVDCHGTHVAGLAVGSVSGVAKRAVLHSVRVANCKGTAETPDVIKGINFVISAVRKNGWKAVINLSMGGDEDAELEQAVADATSYGIPVVCAAGNTAENSNQFSPAGSGNCITVGAADPNGSAAHFSNFGSALDVFAPGVEATTTAAIAEVCRVGMYNLDRRVPTVTESTYPGDDLYTTATGTSFSAPIVTGIVASAFSEINLEETDCTYLERDYPSGAKTCARLLQETIEGDAVTVDSLAYRTQSAIVRSDADDVDLLEYVDADPVDENGSATTTKMAKWTAAKMPGGSRRSRRSLQRDEEMLDVMKGNQHSNVRPTYKRLIDGSTSDEDTA